MKKVNLVIVALFSLFIFSSNVKAYTECSYSGKPNVNASNRISVSFSVADDGFVGMAMYNNDTVEIINVNNVSSDFKSKGYCPTYAFMHNNKLYVYYDYSEANAAATQRQATILTGITILRDSESGQKEYNDANSSNNSINYEKDPQSALKVCDPNTVEGRKIIAGFKFVGIIITIIKIVAPIILIVMGMIDISKAVVDGKDDSVKKSMITFLKRAIAAVLIFISPKILLALFNTITGFDNLENDGDYGYCVQCLLGGESCPDVKFIEEDTQNS